MAEKTNRSFWEMTAFIYGRFMQKNNAGYDGIAQAAAPYLRPEDSVLELACGTGQLTGRLAPMAAKWVATDYSSKMIQHAKTSVLGENIVFEVADATQLPYPDGQFDVAFIANALHVMPHPEAALKEIRRILKPGGILFAPTFVQNKRSAPLLIWLMKKAGLLFHPWHFEEYIDFVASRGFEIVNSSLISGSPLDECFVIGKKKDDCGAQNS